MTCQIAFLIDSHVDKYNVNQLSSLTNAINLTGFRLLQFLSAKFEKKGIDRISKQSHTAIKWGYKFFSSRSCATRIEQHRFRDFKLKYFEEFENEVQRRLENKPQCLNLAVKKVRPSECLSKALTEILSDFPWERPDITSPIRGRKKKKETSIVTNVVVLFARCPKNASELKSFTGKQVPDSEVFLDSLLPSALFHQFCDVNQLSLYWIDIGELYTNTEVVPELCAIKIIEEALLKAKGKVFPVGSVVQCGSPYFSNLATVGLVQDKEDDEVHADSQPTPLLPFTTTLNSFLFSREYYCHEKKSDLTAVLQTGEDKNCVLNLEPLSRNSLSGDSDDNKENLASDLDLESADLSGRSTCQPRLFDAVDHPTFQPYAVLLPNDQFLCERGETFLFSEMCQQGDCGYTRTGILEKMIEKLKMRNARLIGVGKVFDVQWGLRRDDVSTADVLASGTEAEMKAELKARKTSAAPRPTAETQPRPKPKASGKRKAEATSAPPAKKQATKTTKLVKKQEAKLILVSEPEWQKRACASQNNAQPSNQTQDQTTSHTTNQTHDVIANQPHNEATDQTTNQPNQQMHAQTTQQTINQAQSQTTQQAHAQTSNNSHAQTTQQTINQAQSQTTQQAHAQTSNNSHAQTTQQPSKQTQDQTTSHTTNQTNDVTTRNQPHTQTTEQTTNQQTHAQTAQQTHAQTTNQAHVQTSSQTNAPTNHSQRPLKNLQINTQPFSGPGLNFNPSIDEGAAAVTPTVATEFEAFPFDNMSTPSIIRQAITLMDNAETPTQLNPTANGNVTRQLFEGDAPFQDLFPSPGASDRRITQVWDRKMDALNKKMAVVSTQLADLTRMMTFVMQRLNGDYVRNNDYARNNVNIQPYPTYAQEDVLPEPNQQHQQQEVPAFDIVPATSADETFHDIPAHCRISSEKLLQMKTSANSIGNFATFLCARLYPELFTADNLRLKYNYYGQRAQKEPLEQQRRTILERYLLYFYPQLNDPRVFHLNVVNPINEFLRRKVVNLKNALIFG